ncbi:MAG: hypothetical protein ABEJ46_00980 [Gemmatimonadota bacterium]
MSSKIVRLTRGSSEAAEEESSDGWTVLKYAGLAALGAAAVGALGVWLARDQMARHRRDLFSPHPLRRLAALGYLRTEPSVDNVLLLRDYLAWEDQPLLQKRASTVLDEMEEAVRAEDVEESA